MATFVVDSRSLLAVRDTLGRLHDELSGMHTRIFGYWGMLGGRELEGELEHFCGTWHDGVTELAGQIGDLMRWLTEASAAYERIEQRVTRAGSGHGTHSGSGSTVLGGTGSGRGSGSGTTIIGGGSISGGHGQSTSGSGTTVIDVRTAEERAGAAAT